MLSLSSPARIARLLVVSLAGSESQLAAAEQALNAQEMSRANRFVHADVRRRFIMCRSQLKLLLASELGIEPRDVALRYERWGKPQLAKSIKPALHFNVSHSGEWALIVLAQVPVGVDLELVNQCTQYRAIASQILSQREHLQWHKLPLQLQESSTLRLWVCKEALLKAMGLGIAEGLKQVSLPLPLPDDGKQFAPDHIDGALQMHLEDDGTCHQNHWIDSRAWRLQLLDILPGFEAAVCLPVGVQLQRTPSTS